ncbi:class II aldolase/adducin family protein [Streptacidiphilus carbonis]|jgi:L-ribulose-5-phosphate 4-epimerase|uniref:class II aldolase/adducin family protein n=1 Tax=Streptacidiphilus carbonis TaxID=105422 RepID=UPI0005A7702E|nr:class II aldolase/adducin family protein [Streptacidiphilus carbonis]
MTAVERARRQAVLASRALAASGQGDMIWGHVAVRDPEGRGIWIKAPGWGLEEVRDDRLQLVSFDGEVLAGSGKPHKECPIHLEVLSARSELQCSVHTHARAAVAFASLGTPLLAVSHEGALFGGGDVPRFRETGSLIAGPELGRRLAATIGDAPAALMPKHGLVAAGITVGAAVMHAVLLEQACRTQLDAMAAGHVTVHSDPAEAVAKRALCWPQHQLEAGWRYLLRKSADVNEPPNWKDEDYLP